jgi:hypothetical protein
MIQGLRTADPFGNLFSIIESPHSKLDEAR